MMVVGMMSGTSLDGLDLALCRFQGSNYHFQYEILYTEFIPYSDTWKKTLQDAIHLSQDELKTLDQEYGDWLGKRCAEFIRNSKLQPDLISSHGHTIFHQPSLGKTLQIGDGASIHQQTQLPVIYDFRTQDVRLGGQGAPLVPIGDRLLFGDFEYRLNLGGFANISFERGTETLAFDICAVNTMLNESSSKLGMPFDENGKVASQGVISYDILKKLNALDYYYLEGPKSLGIEWVHKEVLPIMQHMKPEEALATYTEHVAQKIGDHLKKGKTLVTGGGAFNKYLIEKIEHYASADLHIPSPELISFKESLVFAFLGYLRFNGQNNVLSSVTGAKRDHSSGIMYS